ncbi:MAG: HicB family protein [Acidiphilium sp. 37-64-53]|jgi:predicted RNase H-like HicB family nuclease|uniref:type II toxin-antitoxin system HicB family antitoxin n=1 Tax=Acidiphilium TaxID=522 RepID=UPI000BC6CAD4|nr:MULTISPECIES: type II toxin-antitoxin system HicB family antitoxin [Acidiphilium]OYW02372.1 MAG: HicB family protein [Acidiphilium sp. 37-64-53]OZB30175.1 MAG: HicB family protein [Acidiphilium sp. 34-64-41]HQT84512.1 type II toxin-antitoxin system HicB family antitoxin [Acidiphilium rubrum]
MISYYPAIIERGSDGFGVFFPDLPGCTSAGDTVQDAAINAEAALQAWLELSAEHGDSIAPPSDLSTLVLDDDVVEAARILVRAETNSRSVRVNITLPEDLLHAIDRYAERNGFSRSGVLAQAARERLRA